jgi:hypothetical protein
MLLNNLHVICYLRYFLNLNHTYPIRILSMNELLLIYIILKYELLLVLFNILNILNILIILMNEIIS